jgi:putative spermidine/putrescine transport system substrate-binding protein
VRVPVPLRILDGMARREDHFLGRSRSEASMGDRLSRRDFLIAARTGALAIAAAELGLPCRASAEENFTISIVGGTWGQGQIRTYITGTDFEKKNNVTIAYDYAQDNIRAAKAIASCGNPVFTTVEALNSQAVLLAEGGCAADYDLDIVTNYKDVLALSKEPPRKGLNNYFAGSYLMAIGLTYNTKEAGEPASFEDLLDPKFKGRVAVPSFDWFGPQFLYAVNGALGASNDNIDRGMQFIADLVKKNNAIVLSSADAGMQAFTRGEIIAMPYWNGRTNLLARNGVPVRMVYPKGWIATGNGHVILKNTKFYKEANRLINNLLDPELQVKLGTTFGYPPSNATAKLPPEFESIRVPQTAFERAARLDYGVMTANSAKNLDHWNKEVLG